MRHSGGKPHSVGDRGQRYEISFFDEHQGKRRVFGWAPTEEGAKQLAKAAELRPGWNWAQIKDRSTGQLVQR